MDEKVVWRCPSNIALVKYWGKRENQIPCNASLSMTLQNAFTETSVSVKEKKEKNIEVEYYFEGRHNEAFESRIVRYLTDNDGHFPLLKEKAVRIESVNSFPHSTGIASSASAFGALALGLLTLSGCPKEELLTRASYLSRLGSGSACRSMFPGYALWGHLGEVDNSSDEYAIGIKDVHPAFHDMQDAILIVDNRPKEVSSSVGHSLMKGHVYAETRFKQANRHSISLLNVLKNGDFENFIHIIEQEALALHAMMMTSENYYLLMKPGTVKVIDAVMSFRRDSGIPVCFTLDAGPNVHVIYPGNKAEEVKVFLETELKADLKGILYDHIGKGPEKVNTLADGKF